MAPVPLVLYHHLLAQWLFLLYSCFSYNSLTSSIGTMVVLLMVLHHLQVQSVFLLYSYIIYWYNGCSYRTLPSTTGPMVSCTLSSSSGLMSVPLVLYHYRLVQWLFLSMYSSIISTGSMVVPVVLYHHLLVQWLFLLYTAIMY